MFRILIGLLCLILLPLPAIAIEVTPMGGYRMGGEVKTQAGDTLKFEEGGSFALAIDIPFQHKKQLELFWSHQNTTLNAPGNTEVFKSGIDYIHVGGTVLFPQESFIPYAVGGLGVSHFSPDSGYSSETRFSISVGGGVKYFIHDRVGLRLEGRGYATWFPDEGYVFCGNNTCTIVASGDALLQFEALAGVILKF